MVDLLKDGLMDGGAETELGGQLLVVVVTRVQEISQAYDMSRGSRAINRCATWCNCYLAVGLVLKSEMPRWSW